MPQWTQHNMQSAPRRLGLGEYTGIIPWKPSDIGNTVLWLDASNPSNLYKDVAGTQNCSTGDKVARWKAYVGGDATCNTAASQPTYYVNQINGYSSIMFGESSNNATRLSASYTVASIAYPWTVGMVIKLISIDNSGGYDYLWCGSSGYGLWQWTGTTTGSTPAQLFGGSVLNGASASVFGSHTSLFGVYNAATSIMRQRERDTALGNSGTAGQGMGSWVEIGNYPGTNRGAEFELTEIIVYNKALSYAEMAQLELYWRLKYNLNLNV